MPKPVIWSPQSENDFSNIIDYLIEHWDKVVAVKFIDITDELITQISINPKQYPIIHKPKKVRKCVITKHNSLYYRDGKESIEILRIYDNRQDLKRLKFK